MIKIISFRRAIQNKKAFMSFLLLLCSFNIHAQSEKINERVVLLTDQVEIFGKQILSTEFSCSYFVINLKFDKEMADNDFSLFSNSLKNFNSEIVILKSPDLKEVAVIISKKSATGIHQFKDFVTSKLPESSNYNVVYNSIKHVQVVQQYYPENKQESKGF